MSLPRELRDMVYSEALALDCKALLRVSKQVREEARPYLWESSFLKLGFGYGKMLMLDSPGPQPEELLYPSLPNDISDVNLAYNDRVLNKLALIQNLAIKIDFDRLYEASQYPPPMLGQAPPNALSHHANIALTSGKTWSSWTLATRPSCWALGAILDSS